jgi:hypothetical protein
LFPGAVFNRIDFADCIAPNGSTDAQRTACADSRGYDSFAGKSVPIDRSGFDPQ